MIKLNIFIIMKNCNFNMMKNSNFVNEDFCIIYAINFKKWLIIDEGACPIFKRIEIEKSEEIRKITFSQDEQLGIYILIKKNYFASI